MSTLCYSCICLFYLSRISYLNMLSFPWSVAAASFSSCEAWVKLFLMIISFFKSSCWLPYSSIDSLKFFCFFPPVIISSCYSPFRSSPLPSALSVFSSCFSSVVSIPASLASLINLSYLFWLMLSASLSLLSLAFSLLCYCSSSTSDLLSSSSRPSKPVYLLLFLLSWGVLLILSNFSSWLLSYSEGGYC